MKTSTRNKFLAYTVGSTAIALLLAVSSAQAVLIDTYKGTIANSAAGDSQSSDNSHHMTFTDSIYSSLTVDAWGFKDWKKGTQANLKSGTLDNPNNSAKNGGLGVFGGNKGQVDNSEVGEWITFSISGGAISGFSLALFEDADQVRILGSNTFGTLSSSTNLLGYTLSGTSAMNPEDVLFDDQGFEYVSVFVGRGNNFNDNDDKLRVQGVYVVPEPSIIALFGLGLVGLGFSSRRRRDI
jgi:hypothetical protein